MILLASKWWFPGVARVLRAGVFIVPLASAAGQVFPWETNKVEHLLDTMARVFDAPPRPISEARIHSHLSSRDFNGEHIFEISSGGLRLTVAASRGAVIFASNAELTANRFVAGNASKPNVGSPVLQARLTETEAERIARDKAGNLGVELGEVYRPWDGKYAARQTNFEPKSRFWVFFWHRYIDDVPVFNDRLLVAVDDLTGKLAYFDNFTRGTALVSRLTPSISQDQAKERATRSVSNTTSVRAPNARLEVHPDLRVQRLYYYVQEEFRSRPPARAVTERLRLVYWFYVGYLPSDPKSEFVKIRPVMVDAVTGEIVPQNQPFD